MPCSVYYSMHQADLNPCIQKDLGANVERETLRLIAKQDAEKIELLAEVEKRNV